jgi:hypothetical protein
LIGLQPADRKNAGDELAPEHLDAQDFRRLARPAFGPLLRAPLVALLGGLVRHVFLLGAEK